MKLQSYSHRALLIACLAIPCHAQTSDNVHALAMETFAYQTAAFRSTETDERAAALDKAADCARKGIAALASDVSNADYEQTKAAALPVFYSALGNAAMDKSDWATAIDFFQKELSSMPVEQTQTSEQTLRDTFQLANAYMRSTPSNLPTCAFYATRAAHFFTGADKVLMWKTAGYCYSKYHGKFDGFETLEPVAATHLNPPLDLTITPGLQRTLPPHSSMQGAPDPATLSLDDKEFIIANGSREDAEKIFAVMKGHSATIPDAIVVSASAKQIQASVSDDAVQQKQSDFTFNLLKPLKKIPHPGEKLTIEGAYDSYTKSPLMIVLINAAVLESGKRSTAPAQTTAPRP